MGDGMAKRDKAPGNCHCCSAIFIRSREQSSMKALQIAYPLRSIRPSLGAMGGGGRRGPINFHYFIVNASFISATSEKRGRKRERKKERWSKQRREEDTGGDAKEARTGGVRTNVSWKGRWKCGERGKKGWKRGSCTFPPPSFTFVTFTRSIHALAQPYLLNRPCSPSLLIFFRGKQRPFASNPSKLSFEIG